MARTAAALPTGTRLTDFVSLGVLTARFLIETVHTVLVVEQHFRKLNAPHLCTAVHDGVRYCDGIRVITPTRELRAA